MPKRKCAACGNRKPKEEMRIVNIQAFCNMDCVIAYTQKPKVKAKAKDKIRKEKKRSFYESDIKTRKAAAKKACHDYIRERDKGQPCICCGRVIDCQLHAGHYLESGNNGLLRFHEDNIHAQRADCNMFKGGDSGNYEENLRKKIGNERVDYLHENKGKSIKRTAEDYKEIEIYYKDKLKELKQKALN